MDNKTAFIIGNGKSRQGFSLPLLRGKGTIFGCNALYRDFTPDYLVVIDDKFIDIINESEFPQHKVLIPIEEERYELNGSGKRSNAGMNAMLEAIKRGYDELYCLGFDFLIKDSNDSLSNVYDNTKGYELDTRANQQDNINRTEYLKWFVNEYPEVKFNFVFENKPMEIHDVIAKNVRGLFYDQLKKEIINGAST